MADKKTLIAEILNGLLPAVRECGFDVVRPKGIEKDALPATEQNGRILVEFRGEDKALRLEQFDEKIYLLAAQREGEITDADYGQLLVSLFDPNTAETRDAKYIAAEFSEALTERFGENARAANTKLPTPVSKASVKSGATSYDTNTLANRLSVMYPELREPYKENVQQYDGFLAEEFFLTHGNAPILATIRANDPQKMKKLFNLLNEIYDDGTNEIQSIIAVTILGAMENDQLLLANCVDYMSEDLITPVIQINKYLASPAGRGSRMRLANPPKYKPKKESRAGKIFSNLSNMQQ